MSFVTTEEQADGVRVLRINNGKPNAVSTGLANELFDALEAADKDADVKAIVLERTFEETDAPGIKVTVPYRLRGDKKWSTCSIDFGWGDPLSATSPARAVSLARSGQAGRQPRHPAPARPAYQLQPIWIQLLKSHSEINLIYKI